MSHKLLDITVHLQESSRSFPYRALNAYTKAGMYCILFEQDGVRLVHKYPLTNIFRVEENYAAM